MTTPRLKNMTSPRLCRGISVRRDRRSLLDDRRASVVLQHRSENYISSEQLDLASAPPCGGRGRSSRDWIFVHRVAA